MDEASEEVELGETSLVTMEPTTTADQKQNKIEEEDEEDEEEESSEEADAPTHSLLQRSYDKRMRKERVISSYTKTQLSSRCLKLSLVSAIIVVAFLLLASFMGSFWPVPSSSNNGKEDNLALTPPMGWNSWNKFECHGLSEDLVRDIADTLVSSTLAEAGYVYVNLDDCWQIDRDSSGVIQADTSEGRFKNGIKALADYIHSKGLKFGLYTDMGTLTCQRRPGSYRYEESDVKTYASWGVDFIKNDDCYIYPTLEVVEVYQRMWDAITRSGRPMIHSVKGTVFAEHAHQLSHMRRIGSDIHPEWDSVMSLVDQVVDEKLWQFTQPGFWNDLDMLEVGNGDLTEEENVAHFALWCAFKAPLILGNDIRDMSAFTLELLTHDELLSVLKDPLAKSVQPVHTSSPGDGSAAYQAVSKICERDDPNQVWVYDKEEKQLKHERTGKCLTVGWRDYLYVEDCEGEVAETRHWEIDFNLRHVNHTLDKCLTTSPQTGAGSKVRDCSHSSHHDKTWLMFNDVFSIEVVKENSYIFKNSKERCLAVGGHPELQIFAGPLSDNRHVAVLLNRDNKPHDMTLEWEYLQKYTIALDTQTRYAVRDVYGRQDLGEHKGSFKSNVDAHSVLMVTLTPMLTTS